MAGGQLPGTAGTRGLYSLHFSFSKSPSEGKGLDLEIEGMGPEFFFLGEESFLVSFALWGFLMRSV